jgi:hypothetical protein
MHIGSLWISEPDGTFISPLLPSVIFIRHFLDRMVVRIAQRPLN